MKDPKEFRERFKRWKDGKLVYENGRALPAFEDGKEPEYDLFDVQRKARLRLQYDPVIQDLAKPLSPVDPVAEAYVTGVALNPIFNWAGRTALVGIGKYAGKAGLLKLGNLARAKLISGAMNESLKNSPAKSVASAVAQNANIKPKVKSDYIPTGDNVAAPTSISWKDAVNNNVAVNPASSTVTQNASSASITPNYKYAGDNSLKTMLALIAIGRSAKDLAADVGNAMLATGIDKLFPDDVRLVINNTVLPRMLAMRPNYRGGILFPTVKSRVEAAIDEGYTEYPKWVFENYGKGNAAGLHFPSTGHISIKEGYLGFAGPHEIRHRIDNRLLPLTETEESIISLAYDDGFLNLPGYTKSLYPERVTTNLDARTKILRDQDLLGASMDELNQILDMCGPDLIFDAVENANAYGLKYVNYLRSSGLDTPAKANALKEAMKYVGILAAPIGVYSTSRK